jgi:hypothetical protein
MSRNSQMKSCRPNNRIHVGYLVFELIRTYRTNGWRIAPLLLQNVHFFKFNSLRPGEVV